MPHILHIDMDAFFAQVEMLRDPKLLGKPVCVGGIPGQDRSVVTAASYEARKYGIHAGMALMQAKRLCPNAIFVRSRGGVYMEISRRVVGILEEICDQVEPSSIDESYLDIGNVLNYWGGAEKIGQRIKERILQELNLTCSVGIAPTRTLAKMATNLQKPDGLTILTTEDIPEKIHPLPVEKVPGIGKSTKKTLNDMGVKTIGQLVNASEEFLFKRLGMHGKHLREIVSGKLDWEVTPEEGRPADKSIGNSRTFKKDTSDPEELKGYLLSLVQMVARRMRATKMAGKVVTITIRYGDFNTVTHQRSSNRQTQDETEISRIAWQLFGEQYITGMPVRLLGVSVSRLTKIDEGQMDIFDRESQLFSAVDELKDRFGEGIIQRSASLGVRVRNPKRMPNFAKPKRNEQKRSTS
ncbi:DNA polymerase IV [candidate division LCP-89 bacterium B3_LCP]|uniref:DNA polymerase IV n=1 Tax=candidate division LCP-89 bacterium B3_LCP TaxID=2012998 RepID=A0A532URL6_UNCL8|nr:MAG: DNA polymerase IV [candidate division LCP-89 bacterium B3_LCP]